jgi:hypothetical protein
MLIQYTTLPTTGERYFGSFPAALGFSVFVCWMIKHAAVVLQQRYYKILYYKILHYAAAAVL